MSDEAARLIEILELKPHPEGGHYREMFRDAGARAHSTAIYFLLRAGEMSRWHRVDAVEVWRFYRGQPLELAIAEPGRSVGRHILGNAVERGEHPQIVVPAYAWQSARPMGDFTLVGCTVAPGFEFAGFEMAPDGFEPA